MLLSLVSMLNRKKNLQKSKALKITIGTTQFKSIRKPNKRFPSKAPPLPNVSESAAAITRRFVGNRSTITQ